MQITVQPAQVVNLNTIVVEFVRDIFTKEERIMSVLEPKYANHQIWHYQGGNIQVLEEELVFTNPSHDDVKDALASAVDFAHPPVNKFVSKGPSDVQLKFNSRFGGIA